MACIIYVRGIKMTGKQMLKLYKENGWEIDRINGSHYVMKKNTQTESIPIHSGKDLGEGLKKYLLKRLKEVG